MLRRSVLVVLLLAAVSAFAQVHTVTRVAIVARPKVYDGPCPANLQFTATIFVSRHPVKVTYEWIRSDGARSGRQEVVIRAAGQGVTDSWTLGGRRFHKTVWEQLHVLAPTGISSPRGVVRVNCR